MKIGIPKEIHEGECRVAITPEVTAKLIKLGFKVCIESQAGALAQFNDETYQQSGAEIISDTKTLWKNSDLILKVRPPEFHTQLGSDEVNLMNESAWLVSFIWPAQNPKLLENLKDKKATVLGMECVPRISRAQKLDALSSMANIAGYRAVIEAAHHFGRFFTGQVTAAGKIPPAKIFVIGAGVAGLSAIGTATSLGAIVRATDTRDEVADQIKSMGGEFIPVPFKEEGAGGGGYAKVMSEGFQLAQREMTAKQCKDVDIVITTALIPGKPAPKLITKSMVESMRPGSVIVDLAAEQGGNCELTSPGQVINYNGVIIIGYKDLPSRLPTQSSTLYANNLLRLIEELCPNKNGTLELNMKDEMLRGTTILENGTVTWPPPPISVTAAPKTSNAAKPTPTNNPSPSTATAKNSTIKFFSIMLIGAFILALVGQWAPPDFVNHFTVFVLACFIGYMVVWNVTASLHTPLMSVTNVISSIIILGAIMQGSSPNQTTVILAFVAILLTSINLAGGFWVTHRMLRMFRK